MISDERLEELVGMQVSPFCETKSASIGEWQDIARELLALRQARECWKLVPVEPTKQMLEASYREASVYSPTAYRAMLAAAPNPSE